MTLHGARRVAGFELANFFLGRLPRRFSYALMAGVAWLIAVVFPGRLAGLEANLRQAFPEASEREIKRMVRANARNYGKFWVDLFKVPYMAKHRLDPILSIEGDEYLKAILDREKGVLVASIHLGAWEGCAAFWGAMAGRLALIAEVLEPPSLWRRVRALRESSGLVIVPLGRAAPRDIMRRLRDNTIVAFAMDRDILGSGKPYQFFGATASIPTGMVELAQRTGAGILPVRCLRNDDGDYRAVAEPPIWVGQEPGAVDETVRYLVSRFESWIRDHPDQWHVLVPLWGDAPVERADSTDLLEEARVG